MTQKKRARAQTQRRKKPRRDAVGDQTGHEGNTEVRDDACGVTVVKGAAEARDGALVFAAGEHEVEFGAASTLVLGGIRVEKGASVKLSF